MTGVRCVLKNLYDLTGYRTQEYIDRFRYVTGLLPRVDPETYTIRRAWLPEGKRAALVISADLELGWAWRYVRTVRDPRAMAEHMAEQTRRNLPHLLELFDDYQIPITWATVGHLFLESCTGNDGRAHPEMPRPAYFENEYWRFASGDWYDCDPATSLANAPEWYAPDLICEILAAKVKHEIACHTFSHIDCSDEHCPPGLMEAELAACQRLARKRGICLTSFVFPANLAGNYASLKKAGFTNYRFHSRYHLGFPEQDVVGLWRIPGGVQWEKPEGWPVKAWISAMQRCVDCVLETGTLLHFWFHPSCESVNVELVFPAVLETIYGLRDKLWITTMGEVLQ